MEDGGQVPEVHTEQAMQATMRVVHVIGMRLAMKANMKVLISVKMYSIQ